MLTINLIGRFHAARGDGTEVTPRGRKACALLALLALAPRKSRTRVWLQDKLWSDRAHEQAAGSLRQCLSEIRAAFGTDREILLSDNTAISLNSNAVAIDVDDLPRALATCAGAVGAPELLEGIDVRDEEFEDWLRTARRAFAEEVAAHRAGPVDLAPDQAFPAGSGMLADLRKDDPIDALPPSLGTQHRLAALMIGGVVGPGSTMMHGEVQTADRLASCQALVSEKVLLLDGRLFRTVGDVALAEFPSAVNALRSAFEIRSALAGAQEPVGEPLRMRFGPPCRGRHGARR
jgi:hypothetical protein